MKKGYRSVPVTIIGDKEIVGFDPQTLAGLLGR
jgi:glutaredoxin